MTSINNNLKQAELAWPEGDRPAHGFTLSPASGEALNLIKEEVIPSFCCSEWSAFSITPQKGITGRFRLDADDKKYFLRITSRIGHPVLEKKICDYLFENKASVNPILSTRIIAWRGRELRLDVRPYLLGEHFSGELLQLESLGQELSKIHEALRLFTLSSEVQKIASARFRHYSDVSARVFFDINGIESVLSPYSGWAKENRDWLLEMARDFDPSFDQMADAQCVHGEIHAGNVIFEEEENRAVILDFEESVHVFAPVSWDLAFAVQRFILRGNPSTFEIGTRVSAFEKGYGKKMPPLSDMMRQIAWFTMAVVFDLLLNHSIITPITELDKFVRLERQAFSLKGVI